MYNKLLITFIVLFLVGCKKEDKTPEPKKTSVVSEASSPVPEVPQAPLEPPVAVIVTTPAETILPPVTIVPLVPAADPVLTPAPAADPVAVATTTTTTITTEPAAVAPATDTATVPAVEPVAVDVSPAPASDLVAVATTITTEPAAVAPASATTPAEAILPPVTVVPLAPPVDLVLTTDTAPITVTTPATDTTQATPPTQASATTTDTTTTTDTAPTTVITPATEPLEQIVAETVAQTNLNAIVEVLDPPPPHVYNLQNIALNDYSSNFSLALQRTVPNSLGQYLDQNILYHSKIAGAGNSWKFKQVSLPSEDVIDFTTSLYDNIQFVKKKESNPNVYYFIAQLPIKIYRLDMENKTTNLIGVEIFPDITPASSKILNYVNQYQDIVCGSQGRNIFYKDALDSLSFFSSSEDIVSIFCLENGNVVTSNSIGEYFLINQNIQTKIFSQASNNCTSAKFDYYQAGGHIICYYLDASNISRYRAYLLNEQPGEQYGNLTQVSSIRVRASTVLPYNVLVDNINHSTNQRGFTLRYNLKYSTSWNQMFLETTDVYFKYSTGLWSEDGTVNIGSGNSFFLIDNLNAQKNPLVGVPRGIYTWNNQSYIFLSNGSIAKYDPNNVTNSYLYAHQVATPGSEIGAMNPIPHSISPDAVNVGSNNSTFANGYIYYYSKVGLEWKLYKRNIVTNEISSISFSSGETLLDSSFKENGGAVFYQKADRTYWLAYYDSNLQLVASKQISASSAITTVADGIILKTNTIVTKLSLPSANVGMNVVWENFSDGIYSLKVVELPSGNYLGIVNNFVSIIKKDTGNVEQLYDLRGQGLPLVINHLALNNLQFYMAYNAASIKTLNLPSEALNTP